MESHVKLRKRLQTAADLFLSTYGHVVGKSWNALKLCRATIAWNWPLAHDGRTLDIHTESSYWRASLGDQSESIHLPENTMATQKGYHIYCLCSEHILIGWKGLTSWALPHIPVPPAFRVCLMHSWYEAEVAAACRLVRKAAGSLSDFPVFATNTATSRWPRSKPLHHRAHESTHTIKKMSALHSGWCHP